MKDQEILEIYTKLAPFLAEVCGPDSEIVIHDVTNPDHSIIAIYNGVSGREIGNPMTDLARDLASRSAYTNADYLLNYTGKSKTTEFLSSTYYIKNGDRLIGLLCINKDMRSVFELNSSLQRLLENFNLTGIQESTFSETFENPMSDMMHTRIAEVISQSGISPSRMTRKEKMDIVHQLDENGVTMMRGAIAEIAEQLSISVPTIYRYIKLTSKQTTDSK